VTVPDSKDTGEKPWPSEVEMVIDVCDEPPRPFLASVLDGGEGEDDWRQNVEYLTERYLPLQVIRERLLTDEAKRAAAWRVWEEIDGPLGRASMDEEFKALTPGEQDQVRFAVGLEAALDAAFSKEEGSDG
jgi:hypothetical protein